MVLDIIGKPPAPSFRPLTFYLLPHLRTILQILQDRNSLFSPFVPQSYLLLHLLPPSLLNDQIPPLYPMLLSSPEASQQRLPLLSTNTYYICSFLLPAGPGSSVALPALPSLSPFQKDSHFYTSLCIRFSVIGFQPHPHFS